MQTDENHVLIIGGRQDSYTSEETWQYNIDDWSLSEGPPLNVAREGHCCGKILINDGSIKINATGKLRTKYATNTQQVNDKIRTKKI